MKGIGASAFGVAVGAGLAVALAGVGMLTGYAVLIAGALGIATGIAAFKALLI